MKRLMLVIAFPLAMVCTSGFSASAQEQSLTITHFVINTTTDATSTTLTLAVELTNSGPGVLNQGSLRLVSVAGTEEGIQGEILFYDAIQVGQAVTAVGIFSGPTEYFGGPPFDALPWKVTYLDGMNQEQTRYVR